MSFGFSVGNFITAIELANKIRKEFVDASSHGAQSETLIQVRIGCKGYGTYWSRSDDQGYAGMSDSLGP
jgi:hypothetical protein